MRQQLSDCRALVRVDCEPAGVCVSKSRVNEKRKTDISSRRRRGVDGMSESKSKGLPADAMGGLARNENLP
jgi:hypothetical protein